MNILMGPELTPRQKANRREAPIVIDKQVLEQAARGAGWNGENNLKLPSDMAKVSPHLPELVRGLAFLMRHQDEYDEDDLKQEGNKYFESTRHTTSFEWDEALKKVQLLSPSARVEQFVDLFLNRREEITPPVPSFNIWLK